SFPSPSPPHLPLPVTRCRCGPVARPPARLQPKPVAVSATVGAAAATAAYYQDPAGGRHGDGIATDGDAAALVPKRSGSPAAKGRPGDLTAEMGARGRSAEPALVTSMAKKKTPKEGKGGSGGDHNVVSSLAAAGAVVLLHARRWLVK
ncbi:hypothetical protein PVAP13_6KG073635, partial [Panicum virgatum]